MGKILKLPDFFTTWTVSVVEGGGTGAAAVGGGGVSPKDC